MLSIGISGNNLVFDYGEGSISNYWPFPFILTIKMKKNLIFNKTTQINHEEEICY